MSQKRYVNRYVPEHVPFDLKWYERDSFMTNIDQLKYSDFSQDPEKCNSSFDMIHKSARGEDFEEQNSDVYYKTIFASQPNKFPHKEKKKAVRSACKKNWYFYSLLIHRLKNMSTYEIFDLLYFDFKDSFDNDDIVFTQKYVVSQHQIRLFH